MLSKYSGYDVNQFLFYSVVYQDHTGTIESTVSLSYLILARPIVKSICHVLPASFSLLLERKSVVQGKPNENDRPFISIM